MAKYRCTTSRRIADDDYVAGQEYEIAEARGSRYAAYFSAVGSSAPAALAAGATGTTEATAGTGARVPKRSR